jgi:hypothetical protein
MRHVVPLLALVPALLVAGCTSAGSTSSKKFEGAAADVSKAVGDLQQAGQRKDSAKLCSEVLAQTLVSKLDSSGTSCRSEMDKAVTDADEYSLDVSDVKVTGKTATATVRNGDDGPTKTLELVREGNRWKVSSLG